MRGNQQTQACVLEFAAYEGHLSTDPTEFYDQTLETDDVVKLK
jgi:hypothetical protein